MKTYKTTIQLMMILVVAALFACDQKPIDPAITLDEVFIPKGFEQSDNLSEDVKTRLDEMRLQYKEDHFYYLKIIDGPLKSEKEVLFPQNELKIEFMDAEWNSDGASNYRGVIVKKIKDEWTNELFQYCDVKPEPKEGMEEFIRYISENLKYPEEAKQSEIEGRVFVQFIVDASGKLKNIQAVKGIGWGCDEEAVRVMQNAPPWNPAKVADMPVKTRMILPITYKLDQSND